MFSIEKKNIEKMEVEQVLHMNGGVGHISYANNSSIQRVVISRARPTLEESVIEVCRTVFPECLRIADLGCSSGPNTLTVGSCILDTIEATYRCSNQKPPPLQLFLNDLPGNDFNTIFRSLPSFYEKLKKEKGDNFGPCFVTAMPGSFYGRLFPDNSMHIVHSSYSLHWLSKVPMGLLSETGEALNKGNIYISKTSPRVVFNAYYDQFQEDFRMFLRCRSEEVVSSGGMILTIAGSIESDNPKCIIEIIGKALNDMVLENIIKGESLDNFNMPLYFPTANEVKKVIQEQGSFYLQKLDIFEIPWDAGFSEPITSKNNNIMNDKEKRGTYVSDYVRAVVEPILVKQFGETIMDKLFARFTDRVIESMAKEKWQYVNLVISLTKKALHA
ncbi:SAM dependent carboxyl methyltransferase [Trema orientale]|uniref:SAM dependent carboxyl methyltransferase n=1 Tax=Trema orientale TaxID=63057 RepID=A0A2P5FK86_TREOI|nr:SAM dependent carboxyl methyltransferase [Trema orientale]